jgi:predicted TIM-barrel fold metal-dependent hydrolase
MIDCAGLDFGLLVQVSVHGTDNSLLVHALESHPTRLRGIAVIDKKTSDDELEALKIAGVVGVRVLDIVGGGVGLTNLESTAARCAELGWHIQVGVKGESYPALVDRLMRLQVPFVMDHMGWCPASAGVKNPDFQAVLHLMRNSDCMIKLSCGFRLSDSLSDWSDTITFAQALVEAAPDRVLWGSDWPHVGLFNDNAVPNVGALLDLFARTVTDTQMQKRVLADNPTRFYGRPGT